MREGVEPTTGSFVDCSSVQLSYLTILAEAEGFEPSEPGGSAR